MGGICYDEKQKPPSEKAAIPTGKEESNVSVQQIAEKTFVPRGLAALCYEKEGNTKFRDRVTLFYDGRLLFERFCWGEAAGLVFTAWADRVEPDGIIVWKRPLDAAVKESELPVVIAAADRQVLTFDQSSARWLLEDEKKSDPAHGYGGMKMLLGRLLGR